MSKYKLPNKEEIRKRASIIVDKADIFEEFNTGSVYDEITPVKKVKGSFTRVIIPVMLVAAAVVLVVNTEAFRNSDLGKALRPTDKPAPTQIAPDETKESDSTKDAIENSDRVLIDYKDYSFSETDKYHLKFSISAKLPVITAKGQQYHYIEETLLARYEKIKTSEIDEFVEAEDIQINENTSVGGSCVNSINFYKDDGNVLFKDRYLSYVYNEKYKVTLFDLGDYKAETTYSNEYVERGFSSNIYYKLLTYGKVYDVVDDREVTLQEMTGDYDALVNKIAGLIYEISKEDENFMESYPTVESIAEEYKKSPNWCLSTDGIVCRFHLDKYLIEEDFKSFKTVAVVLGYDDELLIYND